MAPEITRVEFLRRDFPLVPFVNGMKLLAEIHDSGISARLYQIDHVYENGILTMSLGFVGTLSELDHLTLTYIVQTHGHVVPPVNERDPVFATPEEPSCSTCGGTGVAGYISGHRCFECS